MYYPRQAPGIREALGMSALCDVTHSPESYLFSVQFWVNWKNPENYKQHAANSLKVPLDHKSNQSPSPAFLSMFRMESAFPPQRPPRGLLPPAWRLTSAHLFTSFCKHMQLTVRPESWLMEVCALLAEHFESLKASNGNGNWSAQPNILVKHLFLPVYFVKRRLHYPPKCFICG